jgi:hypothetical protein
MFTEKRYGRVFVIRRYKLIPPPPPYTFLNKKVVFFTVILVFLLTPCFSDEERWYDGFFIEGSFHQYFAPEFLSELVKTKPGFRAALGYDYRHFRFALESGYSSLDGTNPLVTDISIIPFALKFGYGLPIYFGFGAQTDLHLGYFSSKIIRYPTAIEMLMENSQEDNETHFFTGARLYLTWTIPDNYLKVYAGGGVDAIFESDGPIPLPLVEAGLSIKPVPIVRLFTGIVKTERKKAVVFGVVFFEPEGVVAQEESLKALDEFGEYAVTNPRKKILLRSYAVRPDKQQRLDLSLKRAEFCREYLVTKYGIEEKRIKIDPWGSRDTPEAGNKNIKFYDCVELLMDVKK